MPTTKKKRSPKKAIATKLSFRSPLLISIMVLLVAAGIFFIFSTFAATTDSASGSKNPDTGTTKNPDCTTRSPRVSVTGGPLSQYRPKLTNGTGVIANGALWTSTKAGNYPVIIDNSSTQNDNLCWVGGKIAGDYNENTTSWTTYHGVTAMLVHAPNITIENLRVYNTGDGIGFGDGNSENWSIYNVRLGHVHDDCIENDYMHNGTLSGALLESCYSGLSARGHSGQSTPPDGRNHLWTIKNTLISISDTPTVFKGTAPGHGGIFKWSEPDKASTEGYGTMIALENVTIHLDGDPPNHQDYNIPRYLDNGVYKSYLKSCSNVKIVWDGTIVNGVPYYKNGASAKAQFDRWPSGCMQMTTDINVWNQAVLSWVAANPGVAQ